MIPAEDVEAAVTRWWKHVAPDAAGTPSRELYTHFASFCRDTLGWDEAPTETAWGRVLTDTKYPAWHTRGGSRRALRLRPVTQTGDLSRGPEAGSTDRLGGPCRVDDGLVTGSEPNPSGTNRRSTPENPLSLTGMTGSQGGPSDEPISGEVLELHAPLGTGPNPLPNPPYPSGEGGHSPERLAWPSEGRRATRWQAKLDAARSPEARADTAWRALRALAKQAAADSIADAVFDQAAALLITLSNNAAQASAPAASEHVARHKVRGGDVVERSRTCPCDECQWTFAEPGDDGLFRRPIDGAPALPPHHTNGPRVLNSEATP